MSEQNDGAVDGAGANNFFSVGNNDGGGIHSSPFRPPNEEQVFITREAEKQKKAEAKQAAKYLKIWDKKTATSRMPLKRVKDGDIKPYQPEDHTESLYNFNSSQKGYISAAMHIAKSRVQFPRESRPQNINEFIDQKKEMFLVELSYNTIKEEIEDLQLKKSRKATALQDSSAQLMKDNDKLVAFIENDNLTTQNRKTEAEMAQTERKAKELLIKQYDTSIQNIRSEIDKNVDQLNALEHHKQFLFDIFQKEDPQWVEKLLAERSRKKQLIMAEWIEKQRLNPDNDDDDILFSEIAAKRSEKQQETASSGSPQKSSKKAGQSVTKNRANMTMEDQIELFEAKLAADSIDVPPDFYDEDVLYSDAEDLMVIYSYLEEQNRKKINDIGDINEQIDQQKAREKEVRQRIGGEILVQEAVKSKLDSEIIDQRKVLEDMIKQSQSLNSKSDKPVKTSKKKDEEDEEVDINHLMDDLKAHILMVYGFKDTTGQEYQELAGKSALHILHEIELVINNNINTIKYIMKTPDDPWYELVRKQEIERKTARFEEQKRQRDENDRIEKEMKTRNNELKQIRVVKIVGKKQMTRSEKPKIKQEEKKVIIDEETQDQMRYLGGSLAQLAEQAQIAEEEAQRHQ